MLGKTALALGCVPLLGVGLAGAFCWPRWPCHATCSQRFLSGFSGSEYRRRWCSVADAATGRQVGDL